MPDRDGNCLADFTYIDVRHRILQDIKSKLNIKAWTDTKSRNTTYNHSKHDELISLFAIALISSR